MEEGLGLIGGFECGASFVGCVGGPGTPKPVQKS